ncbi:MAG: hypothetical protein LBM87_04240 [Ruminococcus sp.]|jgi:D-alanyl-D-alanine carboxypeptidase (penicillin-binding protein 5/6)|nr:hypothetical protein [Ruminococcus sp.]
MNPKKTENKKIKRKRHKLKWGRIFGCLFAMFLIGGGIFAASKFLGSKPAALIIDAAEYSQITTVAAGDIAVTEIIGIDDEAVPVIVEIIPEFKYDIELDGDYPIEENLQTAYAIIYDKTAEEVLFAKNPENKAFPASTTKLLTAAVLIDTMPADTVFTAGKELELVSPGSSLGLIYEGFELNMRDTIDGLMLPSGNDVAYMAAANAGRFIAEDDTLSPSAAVDIFMNRMNMKLSEIGAQDTHFSVPDGFHDEGHYTTAADMLKIALCASDYPEIMTSVGQSNRQVTFLTGQSVFWENSNKLVQDYTDIYYMYATGMKTGMTDESGYCIVASAERFGHEIIAVMLSAPTSDIRWNETVAMLDQAFAYINSNIETESGENS